MILTSFLIFMKNEKLIKLRIFLEVKNVVTKFLNSLVYRENPKKDDFRGNRPSRTCLRTYWASGPIRGH